MNKHIVTMTLNPGVIDQIITVIGLETEQVVYAQNCTINNYIEEIIKLCDYFQTTFVYCDENLWDWEFTNNNLVLLKEGEIIPEEQEEENE